MSPEPICPSFQVKVESLCRLDRIQQTATRVLAGGHGTVVGCDFTCVNAALLVCGLRFQRPYPEPCNKRWGRQHTVVYLGLINGQQQTRGPCHQANRIKTAKYWPLCGGCVMELNDRSRCEDSRQERRSESYFIAAVFSEVIASMEENNRAIQPVSTGFYLLLCKPSLIWNGLLWPVHGQAHSSRGPQTILIIGPAHHKRPTSWMHILDISWWPRQLTEDEVNGKGHLLSSRGIN